MTRNVKRAGVIAAYALLVTLVAWQGRALAQCPANCASFGSYCGNNACSYHLMVAAAYWCCDPATNRCCQYFNETWECFTNNNADASLCDTWQEYDKYTGLQPGSCNNNGRCQT